MVTGLPGGLAVSPGPRLSCGCKAVGPFLINRELITVLSFIYLGVFVAFGSRISVKLIGSLLELKIKPRKMAGVCRAQGPSTKQSLLAFFFFF